MVTEGIWPMYQGHCEILKSYRPPLILPKNPILADTATTKLDASSPPHIRSTTIWGGYGSQSPTLQSGLSAPLPTLPLSRSSTTNREGYGSQPFTFQDLEGAPTSTISATQAPTSVTSIMHFPDEIVYAAPCLYPTTFEGYGSQPFIFQDLRGAPASAVSAGQAPTFPSSTINFPDETIYAAPPYSMSSISNFEGYGSQFLAFQPNSGFASGSTVYAAPHPFPTNSSTNFERYGFQSLTFQHLGYPLDESLLVTPPTPTTPIGPTPHPTSNDFRHA